MRERLRKDWPIRVYEYWARPIGPLPQEFWELAHGMKNLWNDLVTLREKTLQETRLPDDPTHPLFPLTDKAHPCFAAYKQARWDRYHRECKARIAASRLGWEAEGEIYDRFRTASAKAIKDHADLHRQHGLEKVMIPHRFTGGGIGVAALFGHSEKGSKDKWSRIKLRPVDPSAYRSNKPVDRKRRLTFGYFGIGEDKDKGIIPRTTFHFEVLLHRPLPPEGIVKKVMWVGKFDPHRREGKRWTWSFQVAVEEPPAKIERSDSRVAGLDLGWRILGEELRIGMVVDSCGQRLDLRLPLKDVLPRGLERLRDRFNHRDQEFFADFWDKIELERMIGKDVEGIKNLLQQELPASLLPPGEAFKKMRQRGLRKLLREMRENGGYPEVVRKLEQWDRIDWENWRIQQDLFDRITGRRRWLYENLAHWLTRTYRVIAWEGDLKIKRMAEEKGRRKEKRKALKAKEETGVLSEEEQRDLKAGRWDKQRGIDEAAKFRQWAAIGEFRTIIKRMAEKNGCLLVEVEAKHTTAQCHVCGRMLEKNAGALYLACACGERVDQDINAGYNLLERGLSQIPPDLEQEGELRKFEPERGAQRLDIPGELRSVAITVHL